MHRISPTVAAVAAGIFALLLVIYVFAGGKDRGGNPDKPKAAQISGVPQPGAATRCSSQKTYDLIKGELFRQAADMSGDNGGTFSNVASYSFLRVSAPKLIGQREDTGTIGCAGSLTLDLPPGISVVGGRRSLAGNVAYAIRPGTGAGEDVVTISNADAIITPLSTLSRANGNANQEVASADPEQEPQIASAPVVEPRPQPKAREVQSAPAPRSAGPAPARAAPVQQRKPAPRPSAVAAAPPARAAPAQRQPAPRPSAVAAAPPAGPSPSFNCRSARTRGEIAVCTDGSLASLDQQMAAQFNRAVSTADSGKRLQLQRSRKRFLAFRDSCNSSACIAGAYRDRMREIDDIISERWSPLLLF